MIGYTIVKGHAELETKFLDQLETLKNLKLGRLQKQVEKSDAGSAECCGETGLKGKLSLFGLLDFNSGFFAKFKLEKTPDRLFGKFLLWINWNLQKRLMTFLPNINPRKRPGKIFY